MRIVTSRAKIPSVAKDSSVVSGVPTRAREMSIAAIQSMNRATTRRPNVAIEPGPDSGRPRRWPR